MAKFWLALTVVGWGAFAGGITYIGGTDTGDWEYALSTGLRRIGYLAALSAAAGLALGALAFFFSKRQGRDPVQGAKLLAMVSLMPPLVAGVGLTMERSSGRDPWFVLPSEPSWLVDSLERRNPELDVEDIGDGGVAFHKDGQRISFWPWQLRHGRIDWRKCEPADLELLGAVRPDPAATCAHRVRVEAPAESFTLLAFPIGEADPEAAAKAMRKQYEGVGSSYKDNLVIEHGGVRRRIEGRATRRWANWLYVEVIDQETANRSDR
jgi:hypothetical protein